MLYNLNIIIQFIIHQFHRNLSIDELILYFLGVYLKDFLIQATNVGED